MKMLLSTAAALALLAGGSALAQTTGTTTRPDRSVGSPTAPNGHTSNSAGESPRAGAPVGSGTSAPSGSVTRIPSGATSPETSPAGPGSAASGSSNAINPPGSTGSQLPGSKATGSGQAGQ